jgi:hypothetical protein
VTTTSSKATRRGTWRARFILVLAGLLFGLGIAEIACRLLGYSFPAFYTPNAALGYALLPPAEGWYRREGQTYVRINSEGLRDREHTKAKPPNTIRVAVIGDSYCEALQVPMEQAWWHLRCRTIG